MGKSEVERLAILEEKTDHIEKEVGEVKGTVIRIEEKLDDLPKRYVTRAEALAVSAVLTLLISIVALFMR